MTDQRLPQTKPKTAPTASGNVIPGMPMALDKAKTRINKQTAQLPNLSNWLIRKDLSTKSFNGPKIQSRMQIESAIAIQKRGF